MKFSEALAAITDADAERNQFTLKVNGVSKTVTGISRASDVVTLTVGTADKIGSTDTVTVSYAQATGEEVTDSSNNLNKLANFGTTIVTNGSSQDIYLPTFNAIHADTQVIADGTKIALKFSENMATLTSGAKSQFTVLVNGSSATVDSAALNTSDASIVELTMATGAKIAQNASVEVAYAKVRRQQIA